MVIVIFFRDIVTKQSLQLMSINSIIVLI